MESEAATPALRGVLIDFGGVLTNPLGEALDGFCRAVGLSDGSIGRAMADGGPLTEQRDAYERGELTDEEFMPQLAQLLELGPRDMDRLFAHLTLEHRMFDATRVLRQQGVRTGLLSNSWGTSFYPRELLAEVFDVSVISGEVGMRKPDAEIYVHTAELIGLAPEACVFIDDTELNLVPARAAGITVIHHQTPEQTIAQLEELFALPLAALLQAAPPDR